MPLIVLLGNAAPMQGHRLDAREDAAPLALAAARARGASLKQAMREAEQAVADVVEAPTGELVHRRKLAAFELDPELEKRSAGRAVTEYRIPEDMDPVEVLTNVQRSWETYHSDDPPEWIEFASVDADEQTAAEGSDAELDAQALARNLARAYTWDAQKELRDDDGNVLRPARDAHKCRVGRPRSWKGLEHQRQPPLAGGAQGTSFAPAEFARLDVFRREFELRTSAGVDFQSDVMGNGAAAGAGTGTMRPADYIALTENATAPAAGDTTLAGELAAAGGGLNRAQAAFSHTAGASSYLLSKTFTVNASDVPPKTPAKYGIFNAASAGRMPFSSLISNPPALQAADQITVNVTVNL